MPQDGVNCGSTPHQQGKLVVERIVLGPLGRHPCVDTFVEFVGYCWVISAYVSHLFCSSPHQLLPGQVEDDA